MGKYGEYFSIRIRAFFKVQGPGQLPFQVFLSRLILQYGQDVSMSTDEEVPFDVLTEDELPQAPHDLYGYRVRRIEDAGAATDITGAEQGLMDALPRFLAGNFHEI